MSVLVKGMVMPDYGYVCLKVFANGEVVMTKEVRGALVITGIRDKVGTAVSVPPHGDLIERDKLREVMFIGEQCLYSWDEIEDAIDCASTIIPASEE